MIRADGGGGAFPLGGNDADGLNGMGMGMGVRKSEGLMGGVAVGPGRQGHGSERGGPTGSFSMGGATNQRVASRAKWPRAQGQGCVPRARRALGFALRGSEMSSWHDGTFTPTRRYESPAPAQACFKFKQPDRNLTPFTST